MGGTILASVYDRLIILGSILFLSDGLYISSTSRFVLLLLTKVVNFTSVLLILLFKALPIVVLLRRVRLGLFGSAKRNSYCLMSLMMLSSTILTFNVYLFNSVFYCSGLTKREAICSVFCYSRVASRVLRNSTDIFFLRDFCLMTAPSKSLSGSFLFSISLL